VSRVPEPTPAASPGPNSGAVRTASSGEEPNEAASDASHAPDPDRPSECGECADPWPCRDYLLVTTRVRTEPPVAEIVAALRSAAGFIERVRGDEDEYDEEYLRGYGEAVELLRTFADRREAQARAAAPVHAVAEEDPNGPLPCVGVTCWPDRHQGGCRWSTDEQPSGSSVVGG
jgi:hypothetical protein